MISNPFATTNPLHVKEIQELCSMYILTNCLLVESLCQTYIHKCKVPHLYPGRDFSETINFIKTRKLSKNKICIKDECLICAYFYQENLYFPTKLLKQEYSKNKNVTYMYQ